MIQASQPIGIFDSGIGGLTVTKSIVEMLPQESIINFCDTAHLPYGDKSAETIQSYSLQIVDWLLKKNCKLILIACNSAASAAYEKIKDYIGNRALLVNVIDPLVNYLGANFAGKKIGLIGTKLTVQSQVYQKKIAALNKHIVLQTLATPLLVPILEEGFFEHPIIDAVLQEYLSEKNFQAINALILGCTHYPVIKKSIAKFYQDRVAIIDAGDIVAAAVKQQLQAQKLLNLSNVPTREFYVSDFTPAFAKGTKLFFGEQVALQKCVLA
jgi:glutamate racemase